MLLWKNEYILELSEFQFDLDNHKNQTAYIFAIHHRSSIKQLLQNSFKSTLSHPYNMLQTSVHPRFLWSFWVSCRHPLSSFFHLWFKFSILLSPVTNQVHRFHNTLVIRHILSLAGNIVKRKKKKRPIFLWTIQQH